MVGDGQTDWWGKGGWRLAPPGGKSNVYFPKALGTHEFLFWWETLRLGGLVSSPMPWLGDRSNQGIQGLEKDLQKVNNNQICDMHAPRFSLAGLQHSRHGNESRRAEAFIFMWPQSPLPCGWRDLRKPTVLQILLSSDENKSPEEKGY